ncbi:serine-tRNA(Ala) deacylase AlaX [Aliidongia dinghuensis]|uniref:Alanine--tRNA ligase n=1 Tax=Aliidongia dinghuensis TaxID=1867774 RepID=A0A8J2YSG1_9PROT|nr:alanyl-tRNA editing protein [Aliidongia dinghuensis]GGF13463.1 serine-tRNA(Ala) deacylase AlaX [Aliidongia dinghuensis]
MPGATQLLFRDDAYLRSTPATVVAVDGNRVELDRTVFYPLGGGQPGDRGTLTTADGQVFTIVDTRKGETPDSVLHLLEEGAAAPAPGTAVTAAIDWDYRHRLMRMHSCMHLLCAVVPGSVTGGQISDGKARLDFDVPGDSLDKDEITAKLNALIEGGHAVETRWITDEELAAQPELIRTMSVKPPTGAGRVRLLDIVGVDLQPCGGTHIRNTAEIGPVVVAKIENKGRQNRRINIAFAG